MVDAPIDAAAAARLSRVQHTLTLALTHYGRKTGGAYRVTIFFTADGDHVNLFRGGCLAPGGRDRKRPPRHVHQATSKNERENQTLTPTQR
ncbi:MAG TPA: hypothetical protein VF331_08545 [Polyangiales bacterium]